MSVPLSVTTFDLLKLLCIPYEYVCLLWSCQFQTENVWPHLTNETNKLWLSKDLVKLSALSWTNDHLQLLSWALIYELPQHIISYSNLSFVSFIEHLWYMFCKSKKIKAKLGMQGGQHVTKLIFHHQIFGKTCNFLFTSSF